MRNRDWRLSAKRETHKHRVKQLHVSSIIEQTSCVCYFPSEGMRCHTQLAETHRHKNTDANKPIISYVLSAGIQTQVTLTIITVFAATMAKKSHF